MFLCVFQVHLEKYQLFHGSQNIPTAKKRTENFLSDNTLMEIRHTHKTIWFILSVLMRHRKNTCTHKKLVIFASNLKMHRKNIHTEQFSDYAKHVSWNGRATSCKCKVRTRESWKGRQCIIAKQSSCRLGTGTCNALVNISPITNIICELSNDLNLKYLCLQYTCRTIIKRQEVLYQKKYYDNYPLGKQLWVYPHSNLNMFCSCKSNNILRWKESRNSTSNSTYSCNFVCIQATGSSHATS